MVVVTVQSAFYEYAYAIRCPQFFSDGSSSLYYREISLLQISK